MARRWRMLAAVLLAFSVLGSGQLAGVSAADPAPVDYLVLLHEHGPRGPALAAIRAAGGTVVRENRAIGMLVARGPSTGFTERVSQARGVLGAIRSHAIGQLPQPGGEELLATPVPGSAAPPATALPTVTHPGLDPLDSRLWGMRMIGADRARARQDGDRRVLVGLLDSGVDTTHPDLWPVVDRRLSRNFVTDIPFDEHGGLIDGPCEFDGCVDPVNYDDYGHGTHVAGTLAAAANGFGLSGVAPGVTLVDIRIGQDNGHLLLLPFLDGITYGADLGVAVMDLPFAIHPWNYNCAAHPDDSPAQQLEQRLTVTVINRALDYAHRKGVTLVDEIGYTHEDLGNPNPDVLSPLYPANASRPRQIDPDTCHAMPIEGRHVIGVTGIGPSGIKADYSNYGVDHTTLAAPGGFRFDFFGTPDYRRAENQILSTYSRVAATSKDWLTPEGEVTELGAFWGMVKHCQGTQCAYYRWTESTSRASPHVSGAAALVVSQYGDRRGHRITMDPDRVEGILTSTAQQHACPTPRLQSYAYLGRTPDYDAYCAGSAHFNGFYGYGIVDVYSAVTRGR